MTIQYRYMSFRDLFDNAQERAERHLETCANIDLVTQFANQRVDGIEKSLCMFDTVLARLHFSTRNDCAFKIILRKEQSLGSQLMSVGHELAHTFEFFDGIQFIKPSYYEGKWPLYNEREAFCDTFADRWLQKPGIEQSLTELLQGSDEWKLPGLLLQKLQHNGVVEY